MCDQCKPKKKYWVHIADNWTVQEQDEMYYYLESGNLTDKDMKEIKGTAK